MGTPSGYAVGRRLPRQIDAWIEIARERLGINGHTHALWPPRFQATGKVGVVVVRGQKTPSSTMPTMSGHQQGSALGGAGLAPSVATRLAMQVWRPEGIDPGAGIEDLHFARPQRVELSCVVVRRPHPKTAHHPQQGGVADIGTLPNHGGRSVRNFRSSKKRAAAEAPTANHTSRAPQSRRMLVPVWQVRVGLSRGVLANHSPTHQPGAYSGIEEAPKSPRRLASPFLCAHGKTLAGNRKSKMGAVDIAR